MVFMDLEMLQKGALYSCECAKCGMTLYTHEWADFDHNERRDAMQAGTLRCDDCSGKADPNTFYTWPRSYAARMSADGYMDCTVWDFDTNKRRLAAQVRHGYA